MDGLNPAQKQYLLFAIIISVIFSFVLNFFFIELLEGSFFYGFPMNLEDLQGFQGFLTRFINSLVLSVVGIIPIYLGIQWLLNRGTGGSGY